MKNSQQRADKGVSRGKYKSTIHPKYRSFLLRCNRAEINIPYTEEEYLQIVSNPCFYCGATDRIGIAKINMRGNFDEDNIRVCCGRCNELKGFLPEREFINNVNRIAKHQMNR